MQSLWNNVFALSQGSAALTSGNVRFRANRFNLILSTLTINILSLAFPIMTLQVYDRVLANGSLVTLQVLVIGVSLIIALEVLMRIARAYVIAWSGAVYEHSTTCSVMHHVLGTDLLHVQKSNVGEHLQNIYAISRLRDFYSGQALITAIDLPFVLLFLGLIWYLAGTLVLIPLGLLLIFSAIALIIGKRLKKHLFARDEYDNHRYDFIIETLKGIHTLKAMGMESAFLRRYEHLQSITSIFNYYIAKASNAASSYASLFSQIMSVSVVSVGCFMVIDNKITIGSLIACVLLSGRIMQPIQRAMAVWTRFQDYQLGKEKVNALLQLPTIQKKQEAANIKPEGRLIIDNISFGYHPDEPPLLRNITLDLSKGQAISLNSKYSCGKTTFLKLMAGLYTPTQGKILLDGLPPHQYPHEELVKHIGYLPTQSAIFRGTIRQNLTGFVEREEKELKAITRLLGMDDILSKLPMGYETMLEDTSADPIPPGLKQRVSIGRILIRKPPIILFDNADRSLDKTGLQFVIKALNSLKKRSVLVITASNEDILNIADQHFCIDAGMLVKKPKGNTA